MTNKKDKTDSPPRNKIKGTAKKNNKSKNKPIYSTDTIKCDNGGRNINIYYNKLIIKFYILILHFFYFYMNLHVS